MDRSRLKDFLEDFDTTTLWQLKAANGLVEMHESNGRTFITTVYQGGGFEVYIPADGGDNDRIKTQEGLASYLEQ